MVIQRLHFLTNFFSSPSVSEMPCALIIIIIHFTSLHNNNSLGWVTCLWSRPWGRGGSRIGGHSQGGKIHGHCWTSHVWTNSCWNLGRFQCVSCSASEWSWQEDLIDFWWHQRLVICISEFRCWYSVSMLFCYTTACRSLTARTEHHTLSVYFRQFLNLPRE